MEHFTDMGQSIEEGLERQKRELQEAGFIPDISSAGHFTLKDRSGQTVLEGELINKQLVFSQLHVTEDIKELAKDYFISTIAQEHIAKENGVQESESERAQSNQLNNESPLRSLSGDSDTSNIPQNEEKSSGKANDSFKGTNVEKAVEKYASESILKSARKRVNIDTFCSKDTNKYLINGVYYDEGKKVATNGKYLLVEDAEYPESYEGKIIADKKHKAALEKEYEKKKAEYEKKLVAAKVSGEGTMEYIEARKSDPGEPFVNENGEVKGPYPNYKNVIPDTSSKNYSDITDDFNTNIDKIEKLAYMGKKLEGITKEPTRIKIFGTYFDSSQISDILCVAKNKGGLTGVHFFDEPKATKVAVFEGKGFKVVVMPMRYEYGDNYLDVASGNYEGNQSDEVKDFLKGDADREQRERKEKKIVKENEKIIEEGIESMQVNGGRSDAAMEADYEYEQFPAPEMEETEEESFGFENFTAEALLHLAEISPEAYESLKKEYEQRTGLSADEYLKKAGDKERQEKKESLISQRLKSLLEAQEMTIQELAIKAGVTEAAMLRYINGERIPRGAILLNVANAFGVSVEQITGKEFPFTVGEEIPLDTFTSSYGGENWIIEKINENNVQLGRSTDNIVIQHEGKVMSKEDFLEAVQAIHPELWERGKEAFKKTSLWEQVKNDPSYTDITGDDDLILSECHARICGEIAQSVLEKIAQEDGQIAKDAVVDWDKETWTYIAQNFTQDIASFIEVKDFMNLPIKDLMNEKIISYEQVTPAKENDKNKSDNLEAEKQLLSQFMPPEQLFTTLDLLAGEEGSFFAGKIKEIATAIEKAPKIYETDGMKEHPVILRYFHPTGSETLVCEIGTNGEAFGYQVINGDWVNSEFGYLDINEIKNIPGMEIDYHFPENMSIERWLYTQSPEHFRQYADLFEQPTQESPVPYPVQEQLNQQSPAIEIAFDPQYQPVKDNNISEVNGQDQTETQFFSQSFNLEGKTSTEKVKEITEKLKTGVNEIFESGQYEQYLKVMSKFHDYSTNNTILIALQRPDATRVAGFTTWKNEFQRSVKKGEKGIKILAPMFFKKEHQEKDVTDSETHSSENHEQEENEEQIITRFKVVNVFDICQTEGKELPGLGVDALKGDVEHYEAFYHSLEKTSPVPMAFEAIKDASHGYYDLVDKRIAIKAGLSQLQTIKTAIHEIAHATLHADKNSNTDRSTAEVQAESIAYTVCSYYGLDTSDYSFGYVAGWSRGKEIKELKDSLEIIRKTSSQIITDIDKHFSQIQEKQVIKEKQKTAFAQLELFSREELSNTPSIRKLMIDQALNREHITAGKAALRKYSESVLSGKQEGLWKSFYKFKTKGVFDIVGSKITLNKEGTLTDTSWNQLHTALKIYRDKRFETFRYLFVDNKGMIKDQLTLCSYLPNRTVATLPGKNIIPNIIKHAEETQTRIILAHNHPSGSTSPSFEDVLTTQKLKRIFTNSRGKSLLLGHIILDHDTAEIYDNSKANWYTIQTNKTNKDPLTKNDPLAKTELYSSLLLNSVCRQINETDTWKAKGFVPLVFVSGDKKVSAIKMYPESFFAGSQEDVLKELQHIGSQTGSNWCFPIVQNRKDISQNCTKNIRRLFEKKCFMDYMIEKEIGTELNSSYGGGIFDAISAEERQKRIKIESTFYLDKNNNTIATNTGVLICNEENEVKENTLPEKLFTTKEIKSGQSHTGILKESYLVSQNFFPPMTEKDGTISIYCSSKDLNMPVYALNPNEPVKVNMTKKQVAVLLDTAIKTHILKVKNTKDFKITLPEKSNPNPDFAKMLMSVTPGISYEGIKKEYNKIFNSVSKEMNALRIQVCKSQSPSRPLPQKRVYSGGMEY